MVIEAIEKIKCPKHGTGATLINEDQLEWTFCCEELQKEVEAASKKP